MVFTVIFCQLWIVYKTHSEKEARSCTVAPPKIGQFKINESLLTLNCYHEKEAIYQNTNFLNTQGIWCWKNIQDISREHGVSKATIYNWKSKYGGMEMNELKKCQELEEDNRKLKQVYTDLTLDNKC